jgi:hypothetical protein
MELNNRAQQLRKLNDIWESKPDNAFAHNLFRRVEWSALRPSLLNSELCGTCSSVDIWRPSFELGSELPKLKESARCCDLCRLFYQTALDVGVNYDGKVRFQRVGSTLRTEHNGPHVLSIYVDPGM